MKIKLISLIICLLSTFGNAQNLNIELDLSNTYKTIEVFKNDKISEAHIKELIQLESSKTLLRKLNTEDSVMIQAITKAFNGSKSLTKNEKRFQYDDIKENLDELSGFIKQLKNNLSDIEARLKQSLGPFVPEGKDVQIKIIGITGGNSTGYTFGDGTVFHISLHHMKNDLEFFFQICKHELFHNLQALWFDNSIIHDTLKKHEKTSPDYYSYYMFQSLYIEGTATFLDDLKNVKPTKGNKDWLERYRKNEKREHYIFWMFDRLMINLQTHYSNEDINKFYGTFFLTTFDELGYYMGAKITSYLLKDKPKESLKDYMKVSPMKLINDYIKLSKGDKNAPYHFSEDFIKIVDNLNNKGTQILLKSTTN